MLRDDHRRRLCLRVRGAAIGRRRVRIRQAAVLRHLPGGFFDGERRDDLRLSFVEELKVLFAQIADGVPFGIAHHHRHQHQIGFGLEGDLVAAGRRQRLSGDNGGKENQKSGCETGRNADVHSTTSIPG